MWLSSIHAVSSGSSGVCNHHVLVGAGQHQGQTYPASHHWYETVGARWSEGSLRPIFWYCPHCVLFEFSLLVCHFPCEDRIWCQRNIIGFQDSDLASPVRYLMYGSVVHCLMHASDTNIANLRTPLRAISICKSTYCCPIAGPWLFRPPERPMAWWGFQFFFNAGI